MTPSYKPLALAAFLAVATLPGFGTAKPAKVTGTMPVDDSFIAAELNWNLSGPGFRLRWKTIELDGKIGICGVVYYPKVSTRRNSKDMLRRSFILLDDKKIMRDLRFFAVVKSESELENGTANCAPTGVDAPKTWEVFLSWDPSRYRI